MTEVTGSSEAGAERPRVVVLGGGFAGLGGARKLDRTKAVVDWAWGGFGHERPGRILVGDKEK